MQEELMRSELTSARPLLEELERTLDSCGGDVEDRSEHSNKEEYDDDDDFEFKFEGIDRESEWFPSGEVFPIFDRRLLSEADAIAIENDQLQTVRSAMKKLFIVDDDGSSINDDAELNSISPESYCVWTPGNSPQASPARCKKSSSTGTARGWGVSLKELLIRRSRSDGKKSLVRFGTWKKKSEMAAVDLKKKNKEVMVTAAAKGGGEKRMATYLPYKKAIIGFGFYPSVNGFGGVNGNRPPI